MNPEIQKIENEIKRHRTDETNLRREEAEVRQRLQRAIERVELDAKRDLDRISHRLREVEREIERAEERRERKQQDLAHQQLMEDKRLHKR